MLFGVGAVGVGSFAFFGLSGRNDVAALDASHCEPTCNPHDVDSARTKLIVADTSLAVGVIALGVATYLWLTASASAARTSTRAPEPTLRF